MSADRKPGRVIRVTNREEVKKLVKVREWVPPEVGERVIDMIAESGAILKGEGIHFVLKNS